jgi:hypothetical protein
MASGLAMDGIPPIVDPMQYNAPMELYDSIWVGKYTLYSISMPNYIAVS